MVQKRPFVDEETYEVSCKYQRQLEYSNQLVSFLEFVPAEDTTQQPKFSGEGRGCFIKGDEKHTELLICTENDGKTSSPDSVSNTSLDSSSVSKEDNGSEVPFHLLFSHDHCNPDWPRRTLVHSEEIYTSLLECPPRKLVPVGPDFQADIPEWGTQGTNNVTGGSNGSETLTHFPQANGLCFKFVIDQYRLLPDPLFLLVADGCYLLVCCSCWFAAAAAAVADACSAAAAMLL